MTARGVVADWTATRDKLRVVRRLIVMYVLTSRRQSPGIARQSSRVIGRINFCRLTDCVERRCGKKVFVPCGLVWPGESVCPVWSGVVRSGPWWPGVVAVVRYGPLWSAVVRCDPVWSDMSAMVRGSTQCFPQ